MGKKLCRESSLQQAMSQSQYNDLLNVVIETPFNTHQYIATTLTILVLMVDKLIKGSSLHYGCILISGGQAYNCKV
ncbi:hypothetical protein HAX54_015845, partial [Datura stramonium]|nr:hypothetical protein [Datura stramonium]